CKRTGLDPIAKQIYAVFRWNSLQQKEVMVTQAGIDGLRLVAQRTGSYAGQDDTVYSVEEVYDPITFEPRKQLKASTTVYRIVKGQKIAFTASALWNEYAQKTKSGELMGLWKTMPQSQLGKCSEAKALRKGFPNELSGIYVAEEMAQADNPLAVLSRPIPSSGRTLAPSQEPEKSPEETLSEENGVHTQPPAPDVEKQPIPAPAVDITKMRQENKEGQS
ncbi:MAG: phage recombination protein Bet, partial [Cyclobacteriaceae bacterium]